MGGIVFSALNDNGRSSDSVISRAFLSALSESFPQIMPADANKLVTSLLDSVVTSPASSSSTNGDSKGVSSFNEESMEQLEKQEIAFQLIERILDKVQIDTQLLERVRLISKDQLRLMTAFLKVTIIKHNLFV